MSAFFNTPERIAALQFEAGQWIGTPFFSNGNTKGMGVSCQKLVGAIYAAVGFCQVEIPDAPMCHGNFAASKSLVTEFMATRPEFLRVPVEPGVRPMIGDLVAFRLGRVPHHLAIVLTDGGFIHAMEGIGVAINYFADGVWGGRLAEIWRPRAAI